jgi:hypothetical protein
LEFDPTHTDLAVATIGIRPPATPTVAAIAGAPARVGGTVVGCNVALTVVDIGGTETNGSVRVSDAVHDTAAKPTATTRTVHLTPRV